MSRPKLEVTDVFVQPVLIQEGFKPDYEVEVDLVQVIVDRLSRLEREVSDLRHQLHAALEEDLVSPEVGGA